MASSTTAITAVAAATATTANSKNSELLAVCFWRYPVAGRINFQNLKHSNHITEHIVRRCVWAETNQIGCFLGQKAAGVKFLRRFHRFGDLVNFEAGSFDSVRLNYFFQYFVLASVHSLNFCGQRHEITPLHGGQDRFQFTKTGQRRLELLLGAGVAALHGSLIGAFAVAAGRTYRALRTGCTAWACRTNRAGWASRTNKRSNGYPFGILDAPNINLVLFCRADGVGEVIAGREICFQRVKRCVQVSDLKILSRFSLRTFRTLGTGGARCTGRTLGTLFTMGTNRTLGTLRTLQALRAGRTLRSCFPLWPDRTLRSFWSWGTFWALRPGKTKRNISNIRFQGRFCLAENSVELPVPSKISHCFHRPSTVLPCGHT